MQTSHKKNKHPQSGTTWEELEHRRSSVNRSEKAVVNLLNGGELGDVA